MIESIISALCKKRLGFFAVLLCAFVGASIVTGDAFAAQIPNSAFSTSNLVVKAGSAATDVPENGTIDCGSSIGLDFDWEINSETTLAAGDVLRANPKGTSSENHIPLSVRETAPVNILGENNEVIATWSGKSNGVIEITVAEAGAGTHTLSGHLYTGMNLLISACRNYDVNDTIMADTTSSAGTQDVRHVTIPKAVYGAAPRHYGIVSLTSAKTTLSAFTPTQTINSIYASNGQETIDNRDIIKDLWIEADSSEEFDNYIVDISARIAVPAGTEGNVANMEGGVSMNGINAPLPECGEEGYHPCKQKINANEGETKEAFVQRLQQTQGNQAIIPYGRIGDSIIAYFGNIPSSNSDMVYKKAVQNYNNNCTTFYCLAPDFQPAEVSAATDNAVGEGNVYGGAIMYYNFVSSLYFTESLSVDGQQVTSTGVWHYRNGDDRVIEDSKSATKSVSIGSGSAVIERGTASLQLIDKDTKAPIKDASFRLQVFNGQTWQDVANSERTTGNDGKLEIDSLNNGDYRWVQTGYADHYENNSAEYYDNTSLNNEISSFTLGSTGYNTIVTNERQSFTVTFAGGTHASSSFENIVNTQKYGDTTIIPSSEDIRGVNGWYFDGWDKTIATKVTEDATYTATWKAERTSIRGNIVWLDANNDDGVRPERVYVNAVLDGTTLDRSVLVNENGEFEITGMNKCDNQGGPYDYSVMAQVNNYTSSVVKNNDDTLTVYLTHDPKVSIRVNKRWEDNNNKYNLRPATITFNVMADGRHSGKTATISKNDSGTTIEDLSKYSSLEGDGTPIQYSIYEDEITYYSSAVVANGTYEFTVTNIIDESARTDCMLAAAQLSVNEEISEKAIEATISAIDDAPMPDDAEDGEVARFVNADGSIDFDDVEFPDAGEYEYKIHLASDSYNIGKSDFTVRFKVKRDIASNTLCVVDIVIVDDGVEKPISEFDVDIHRKESDNPNTAATKNTILFVVFGAAIAASGFAYRAIRRR